MSLLQDCEFLNAAVRQGRPVVDRCRELRTPIVASKKRQPKPSELNFDKKHVRCPGCGGMVILPCLLCSLERWTSV
ncbi:hypothetical protein LCGC14_1381240 [marine sediment metagenome]|uniref:Uncharacterized protein n=1 Tax=marine sediment metagenome TaxID=412755 RepID=A0A0F9K307_9ZZZZ